MLPKSVMLALTQRRAASVIGDPHTPWPIDEDYWLRHCEGFRVDDDGKRLGVVECVAFRSRADVPDVILVRSGRLHLHVAAVAVSDVVEVRPAERRLVVRTRAAPELAPSRAPAAPAAHDRKDTRS